MKKRIVINIVIFTVINSLICVLSNTYSYFSLLELFNFYDEDSYLNLTLLVLNVSFISSIIITINDLVEEKIQIDKYIKMRSNQKQATYIHIIRLIKEVNLIVFSKITLDFIFFCVFDRINFKCFLYNSVLLYASILLWLILFDLFSNLNIKNNILVLFFISTICISYILLKYSDIFLLLIIRPYDDNIIFFEVILFKIVAISLALCVDVIIKLKKEYY